MSVESGEIGTDVSASAEETDLPKGWARGTVGDLIVKADAGKSFKCDPRPAEPDEWGIITVTAMTWGEFRPAENKALLDERLVNPAYEIQKDDVLVSRANTVEHVGAPVLVGEVRPRLLLSDKSIRFQPGLEVDRKWFTYWLRSPAVRKEVEAKASGTSDSMRNISQPDLKAISIPVPPAAEQRRIAEALDRYLARLDAIDALLRAAQDQVSALRQACLVEAFAGRLVPQEPGDESADDLLKRISAEREAAEAERKAIRRAAALARGKKRKKPETSDPDNKPPLPSQVTEPRLPLGEQTLLPEEFTA
ncbi:restriction endonuclease subunit S [Streptomyces salinarius]|uniref:restriction endonuclease subunit S n=1 Tax=Streptomyces salinarius TaxID=2762598 RepID=UPI002852A4F4|nr:restriction endonuclease subunit S [Streptomyces salinarius]